MLSLNDSIGVIAIILITLYTFFIIVSQFKKLEKQVEDQNEKIEDQNEKIKEQNKKLKKKSDLIEQLKKENKELVLSPVISDQ